MKNPKRPGGRTRPRKLNRGIMFGEDVLEYLATLEVALGCSRSYLVNSIIRMHAVSTGTAKPVMEVDGAMTPVIRM